MGLFKRNSKNSAHCDRDENESFVSVSSARTSNTSLRSPGYKGSGLPASIPEMPIAGPPDPVLDPVAYLRSIHAVRERANVVLDAAKRNQLNHFDVDMTKFKATAQYVVSIIKVRNCSLERVYLNPLAHVTNAGHHSETTRLITRTSLHMAAGNTLTLAADHESTSSSSLGLVPLIRKNVLAVSSIYSWSLCSSMPVLAPSGHINPRSRARCTRAVKVWPLPA